MQDRTMIVALIAVVGSFLSYQTVKSWHEADAPRVTRSAAEHYNEPPMASEKTVTAPARKLASE